MIKKLIAEQRHAAEPGQAGQGFHAAPENILVPLPLLVSGTGVFVLPGHRLLQGHPHHQPDGFCFDEGVPIPGHPVKGHGLVLHAEINLRADVIDIPRLGAPGLDIGVMGAQIPLDIGGEWIGKVNELKTRLQRGKEIAEQINILGDDGVPVEYHVIFWKSELIDFVSLQQDAFDEIDAVTPMERQEDILNMIIDICHTEFDFDNFNEVMDYFKKMINVCKQMNYSKFKSEQYEGFQKQLKELIAERSVNS